MAVFERPYVVTRHWSDAEYEHIEVSFADTKSALHTVSMAKADFRYKDTTAKLHELLAKAYQLHSDQAEIERRASDG